MSKKMELPKNQDRWYVLASVKEVSKKPKKFVIFDKAFAAYKFNGRVVVVDDMCPHRGAPMSKGRIVDGAIECPYHGWLLNEKGRVVKVPGIKAKGCKNASKQLGASEGVARRVLGATLKFWVIEEAGYVWVNFIDKPAEGPSYSKDHHRLDYFEFSHTIGVRPIEIYENFLDPIHTFFVHKGLLRSDHKKSERKITVKVNSTEGGYRATYFEKPTGLTGKLFGKYIQEAEGRFLAPGFTELEYKSVKGIELLVTIQVKPISEHSSRAYFRSYYRRNNSFLWLKSLLLLPIQYTLFFQDKRMLEWQGKLMKDNPGFKPKSTVMDIMRPAIENVMQGLHSPMNKEITVSMLDR